MFIDYFILTDNKKIRPATWNQDEDDRLVTPSDYIRFSSDDHIMHLPNFVFEDEYIARMRDDDDYWEADVVYGEILTDPIDELVIKDILRVFSGVHNHLGHNEDLMLVFSERSAGGTVALFDKVVVNGLYLELVIRSKKAIRAGEWTEEDITKWKADLIESPNTAVEFIVRRKEETNLIKRNLQL